MAGDLLPETQTAGLGELRLSADPETFIRTCETARSVLGVILGSGDINRIAEARTDAEAFWKHAKSKKFPQAARLAAAELLRRAERGIGLAIQRGQADGTVRRPGGRSTLPAASDYVRDADLNGRLRKTDGNYSAGIYALVTGITDDMFEKAIAAARAEGNLSRANVARKASAPGIPEPQDKPATLPRPGDNRPQAAALRRDLIREWAADGCSSRQMGQRLSMRESSVREIARKSAIPIPADQAIRGTRHLDSERIIRQAAQSLESITQILALASPADLDPVLADALHTSMTKSVKALNQFTRTMKEIP